MAGPLQGLVVVEASWGAPGRIAGMLLADYGADVVAVRRPGPGGGAPSRLANATSWDRGKRLVALDLATPVDRESLHELLGAADVFVEALGKRQAAEAGLAPGDVAGRYSHLVHAALTGYGQSGPWADRPGYDALVAARLGAMTEQAGPRPGPRFLGHPSIAYTTAFLTVIGALGALQARRSTGKGQTLDVSLLDGLMAMSPMNWWFNEADASYLASGNEIGFGRKRIVTDLFVCADGEWLMMHTGGAGGFKRTMDLLGLGEGVRVVPEPEMGHPLDDHEYQLARIDIHEVFKTRKREEWIGLFQEADLAVLPVLRPGEVLLDDQVRHAGVVVEMPDPAHGTVRQAGPCITFDASPASRPQPAPTSPEPSASVVASLQRAARSLAADGATRAYPLSGVRILDFSNYFATAYGAKLLADLGADVIKIEGLTGDPMRPLPNPFEACQRGKRAIALDLKHPDGRAAAVDLARTADVVLHNFRPGKAEKLGIGYEQLALVRPDLIYCYLPGFGSTGPKSGYKSFAPLLSGFTGPLFEAAGEGRQPVRRTIGNEDYNNGFVGAVAVLMALEHRARTGQGQRVENPQLHSSLFVQTHQQLDADDANVTDLHLDTDQLGWGPLYRLYETSDGWVCVACVGDAAFVRLAGALGLDGFATDVRFASGAARAAHADELATALGARFAALTVDDAFARLDAARVPCEVAATAPVQPDYLWEDWALEAGRVFEQQTVPYGYVREIGLTLRLLGTPGPHNGPAPLLGEHSRELLAEIGWDAERIDALLAGPCRQYVAAAS